MSVDRRGCTGQQTQQKKGESGHPRARIISRRWREAIAIIGAPARPRAGIGDGNQMVKFTVNELPPIGSDGIDVALPFGSFMMIPFGERDSFGLTLLTLMALNVVEP
jgi:hypothetical protein